MSKTRVPVVVLAGGVNKIELYPGYQPGYKALIEFHGKPSLQYTLEAVEQSGLAGEICVVGSESDLRPAVESRKVSFVPGGETLMESVVQGVSHFSKESKVLICTADIPLVTGRIIREFLEKCDEVPTSYDGNLFISVVPKCAFEVEDFSGQNKGFNRFRDITICHGNLMLADPRFLDNKAAMKKINGLYAARKNPIKAALAVGFRVGMSFIFGAYLFKLLTLSRMAELASWRFGMGLLPVICPYPEIAIDVDEPADYALVSDILARRA